MAGDGGARERSEVGGRGSTARGWRTIPSAKAHRMTQKPPEPCQKWEKTEEIDTKPGYSVSKREETTKIDTETGRIVSETNKMAAADTERGRNVSRTAENSRD